MKYEIREACKWLSVMVCVIYGLYITKNPNVLWTFLIPTLIDKRRKNNE